MALAVVSDRQRLEAARQELEGNYYAASTKVSRASLLRTFCRLAEAAGHSQVFPLTPGIVADVAAGLRAANFRSADKYLDRARQRHVELGHALTEQLRLKLRQAETSCARGLGPGVKAAALELDILARAPDTEVRTGIAGAPAYARRAGAVACWFLLREIELSAIRVRAMRLDFRRQEASLFLPEDKTDPGGEGKLRTHGCCCGEPGGTRICPFHLLVAQRAYAVKVHGGEARAQVRPLFPTRSGAAFSKAGWSAALRGLTEEHETEAERLTRGSRVVKGHSARRGGAQFLARALPVFVVQVFGRWGSDAIRGYVEDAPIADAGSYAAQAVARWSAAEARSELARSGLTGRVGVALQAVRQNLRAEVVAALRAPAETAEREDRAPSSDSDE